MIFVCAGRESYRSRRVAAMVMRLMQSDGEPVLCHECFCWHVERDRRAPDAVAAPNSNKEFQ